METLAGLVVIGLIVAVVRSLRQGRPSPPPPLPPGGGLPRAGTASAPAGPSGLPPVHRAAAVPTETPDDAFAVGFLIGREHGRDDAERHVPVAADPAYDVLSYSGDDAVDESHGGFDDGFDDDAGDW